MNEDGVKHLLTSWLKTFDVEAYWEKKNKWNYPVFKSNTVSKPDLIIKKRYGSVVFAIEVKDANGGDMNILDSFTQISKYAKANTNYLIDGKDIKINGFLVATQNSLKGHLFNDEYIKPADKGRLFAINRRQVPAREYDKTLNFIRLLWRNSKAMDINVLIGALLSNQLNNDNSIAPLLFFKTQKWSSYMVWDKL